MPALYVIAWFLLGGALAIMQARSQRRKRAAAAPEWAAHARGAVKVDDFSADFGILEALQKRSAALARQLPEMIA
ncbi:hypothetical protein AWB77_06647 [Caballeronia fortuita]|uniref:Uncharacterized protein n=1 Tax=Caballeronia fortuita TaxID=1777138 RepID=A0A158E7H7_9BURK|nr:hypothetical protein [Caballeronia fortuita]SAL02851.1 hypothetical protein AWB77_06647 [Caballeronia fortuita]